MKTNGRVSLVWRNGEGLSNRTSVSSVHYPPDRSAGGCVVSAGEEGASATKLNTHQVSAKSRVDLFQDFTSSCVSHFIGACSVFCVKHITKPETLQFVVK